ncbi:MAG: capsular biosynthesis protein [Candidatus Thiocaldithrix dubininis]|uniref:protein-tyrosine-phosphatase n=1 Tax=Candidatus Thiocaldithrix dubininis TaxID=3080823 RepID=A0AA95H9N3_9GAMM|nr:MAG: capsular biosynthesis protein [Candidatus Thiocaldithrix dubininis]
MIDLHSHILPALCDGSQNLKTSLQMARMAVADGTTHLACTPHIYPGVYANNTAIIEQALSNLQAELDQQQIPLTLIIGADIQLSPQVMRGLKNGTMPTLHHSRYFLLEPSHHVPVTDLADHVENFINAGFIPIITHPERLHWIDEHYAVFVKAAHKGAWIQITAGAITGVFGKTAQKYATRFLQEGLVHIIASDAHNTQQRPPTLSAAVTATMRIVQDQQEVLRMVLERPQAVLDNSDPQVVAAVPALQNIHRLTSKSPASGTQSKSWLFKFFK